MKFHNSAALLEVIAEWSLQLGLYSNDCLTDILVQVRVVRQRIEMAKINPIVQFIHILADRQSRKMLIY